MVAQKDFIHSINSIRKQFDREQVTLIKCRFNVARAYTVRSYPQVQTRTLQRHFVSYITTKLLSFI